MRRATLLFLCMTMLPGCTGLFFQPMREHVLTPDKAGLAFEDVYFESADGTRLHAWWLPAKGRARGTVFHLHGNAENISTHIGAVYWLPERGYNVFLPDYRGYGTSQGTPALPGVMADIEAAFSTLLARRDVDAKRIAVFGQSLGGSLAIYFTAHTRQRAAIRALVVESPFSSYRAITREKLSELWITWPFQWLPWLTVNEDYSPLPAVGSVSPIPLLVIHGDRDAIVPMHHGKQLYEAAREPKQLWIVPGGGHTAAMSGIEYRDRLVEYLKRVGLGEDAATR